MAEEQDRSFFYANVMEAHLGAFDFTIDFGFREPNERNPSRQVRVSMSLSHAKTMLPILARLIATYEQQFGTIPAPGYEEMSKE